MTTLTNEQRNTIHYLAAKHENSGQYEKENIMAALTELQQACNAEMEAIQGECDKLSQQVSENAALTAKVAELEHELTVTKASESYNAQYARAFELEKIDLQKKLTSLESQLKIATDALKHEQRALMIIRDRQDGKTSIADIMEGLRALTNALATIARLGTPEGQG